NWIWPIWAFLQSISFHRVKIRFAGSSLSRLEEFCFGGHNPVGIGEGGNPKGILAQSPGLAPRLPWEKRVGRITTPTANGVVALCFAVDVGRIKGSWISPA